MKTAEVSTEFEKNRKLFNIISVLVLFLLVAVLFANVLLSNEQQVLSDDTGDVYLKHAHTKFFSVEEIKNGNLPLWNPYIYSGTSFIADPESSLFYPPNLIYLILPLDKAINIDIVLHILLTGIFMYLWVLAKGLHPLAALLSSVALIFSGAFYMHMYSGHLMVLASAAWVPLLLFSIDRFVRANNLRWILLGSFAVAMSVLAGHFQYVFITTVASGLYTLSLLIKAERKLKLAFAFAIMCAAGAVLAAIQLLPVLDYVSESFRTEPSYNYIAHCSFHPKNLITLAAPNFFGNMDTIPYWGNRRK